MFIIYIFNFQTYENFIIVCVEDKKFYDERKKMYFALPNDGFSQPFYFYSSSIFFIDLCGKTIRYYTMSAGCGADFYRNPKTSGNGCRCKATEAKR